MPRSKPKYLTIEFDDGSKVSSDFESLPFQLQHEILRQEFTGRPSLKPDDEKFVLLEWDDGWKEITLVDEKCTDINRYYVISRPEDVGRLSLNKDDGYPELIEITRKPLHLKKITFLDTFELTPDKSNREGDKIDHFYALKKEGDSFFEIVEDFKKVVEEEGIDLSELGSRDPTELQDKYEKIRQKIGLNASLRQYDVYDFLGYLSRIAV